MTDTTKKPLRILVVDDEGELAESVAMLLGSVSGNLAEVKFLTSPQKALNKIQTGDCDLLITDWDMPNMNGFTLATDAKNAKKDFPVIIRTGQPNQERRENAAKIGVPLFDKMKDMDSPADTGEYPLWDTALRITGRKPLRVLISHTNDEVASGLETQITTMAGNNGKEVEIVKQSDPGEALFTLQNSPFDLLLTNNQKTEQNTQGLELAQRALALSQYPLIAPVIHTASNQNTLQQQAGNRITVMDSASNKEQLWKTLMTAVNKARSGTGTSHAKGA